MSMKIDVLYMKSATAVLCAGMVVSGACAPAGKDKTTQGGPAAARVALATAPVPGNRTGTGHPTVLFIGTSLTAGYGLAPDRAFPALIERKADSAGIPIKTINAGVSGETSAGALHRIDWVLRSPADVVVIETGANDALRGLPVAAARANIATILDRVKAAKPHAKIFLVQMEAPPNLGADYTTGFHDMYGELAREKGVTLVPFLLQGVAGNPDLNQGDGVHPNSVGEQIVAQTVWDALEPTLRSEVVPAKLTRYP